MGAKLVPTSKVHANDYNPNHVARPEMKLLVLSIEQDGLTQPIVTFYDKKKDEYIVVDGFHRYTIIKDYFKSDVIPVVVIDKPIGERMASTIRHNRARGVHRVVGEDSATGMNDIVAQLQENGWDDLRIAEELGMTPEELLRLKQTKGVARMLKAKDYASSWEGGF
jgi:ParB-like chromosome segregation protein Spo0J